MMQAKTSYATLIASSAAALLLMACNRPNDESVGEKIDSAVEKTGQQAERLGQKLEDSPAQAAQKLQDARITASIKAELAKDPMLSPLAITVDTKEGLVSLGGKAPDPATREHATRVAATIKGVLSVDNHMVVNS